jgi:signal transduction histidine kinase/uncharacterized protein YdhG (YjbR/CyaY superfamily)
VMARPGKPKKVKADAKRPRVRRAPKDHVGTVRGLEERLAKALEQLQARDRELAEALKLKTEALEQQTATADILRVISEAQTDVQPVLDVIAESAVRLCGGYFSRVALADGRWVHIRATYNLPPEWQLDAGHAYPAPLASDLRIPTSIRECRLIHILDMQEDSELLEVSRQRARIAGYRTWAAVPMIRDGRGIGTIAVARRERKAFSGRELALLRTFAAQAVIAIENVRLFKELEEKNRALSAAHTQVTESLQQQTATSEILRVIASSPTDVQPVFDTIAQSARKLCEAGSAQVVTYDGELMRLQALDNTNPERTDALEKAFPMTPSVASISGRAILTGRPVHIPDIEADPDYDVPVVRNAGLRSAMAVPMLREGTPIGTINVHIWTRSRPFSDEQVALLQTFAAQAVIAIENVRLFTELQTRTGELTRSVEKLTALGQVSQAVSATLDLEIVLATIVSRAVDLSGGYSGIVYEFDATAQSFHARATHRISPEHLETLRATPVRLSEGAVGRAGVIRRPVEVADIEQGELVAPQTRGLLIREGMGSLVAVPLVREDQLFGALVIVRRERGAFSPEAVATLQTFATPSALAIQNARLFEEIADKSRELEAASRHKSEFLANMSHELRTPLNAIIGYSELLEEEAGDLDGGRLVPDLQKIATAAKHQLSLINDILDLSKIEAGRMELEATDFDLADTIDNALTLVRERATRRGITLGREIDDAVGVVRGDERKVKQVLLNLLSNAIKFTPEGGRIDVRAAVNGGLVEVSVADTGVGIAPDDQEAVFEEFRQVGTADKKVEGTGLGLALARKVVELHGGRIWVTSQVGHGSTFTFTLPVRPD